MRRGGLSMLLFVSGATGLVYEVVWSKVLSDVLGNSGQAHAIVLATFMGGLALGAFLFGGLADRLQRPLALYGFIEVGVGLYALVFPQVQAALGNAFFSLASGMPDSSRAIARLAFAALALLPPTIAMGGTMPAMLKHATRADPSIRAALAHLYALNSLGAALGAWVAGTVWIPNAGLSATTRAAGAVNLLVGAVSLWLARRALPRSELVELQDVSAESYGARSVGVALFGLGVSGFCAMLFETGWIRLVTLTVGGSTYAFTWIVTAFVLGIALGSLWISRRPEGDSLRLFGSLQAALVIVICATLPAYLRVPWVFLKVRHMLSRTAEAFPAWQGVLFFLSLLVMLAPTFVMGAAFPVGARVVARARDSLGRRVGVVWAVNTAGTVLGALLGGLWLLPALGLEALFTIGLALTTLAAGLSLASAGESRLRFSPVLAAGAAFAIYLASFGGWAPVLARLSPFRANPREARLDSHEAYLRQYVEALAMDFVRDDAFATVFVGHAVKNPAHRFLLVNGKPDASTGEGDQVTQTMLGQLGPLLVRSEAKKVMVVGAGAGVTVGAALTHPIDRLDLVEISPGVLEAARLFSDLNHGALDDPRTRVHLDDARTFLSLSRDEYDVIISEPSNPWVAGISSLFTREFFEIVDKRLAPGGVLVQWIHTYEMSDDLVRLVLRTLRSRFAHVTAWQGGEGDLLLLASREPLAVDFTELARRVELPRVKEDLAHVNVSGADGVLALQMMSGDHTARFAGEGALNRDDFNLLEYRAPEAFFTERLAHVPDARRLPSKAASLEISRWLREHPLDAASARRIARAVASGQLEDAPIRRAAAMAWASLAPDDVEARMMLSAIAVRQREPQVALDAAPSDDAAAIQLEQREAIWSP